MRNGSYEVSNAQLVAQKVPGAREILREHRIDTSNMRLRDAALAAGVEPDELLAQIEARARRMAHRAATRPVEHEYDYDEEFTLI